jgi:5-methylthioadenosine/S-adenosylhomocysteine deaminase
MKSKDVIMDGAIAIKNGKIAFIGSHAHAIDVRAEKEIDAKRKVALPGLVNCHTHAPMTLFRGLAEDQPLDTWIEKTIWPLEAKLTAEDVYTGALLGCLEMIKSGTTCFGDMYFHEDTVAKAVEESGLRGVLAEGIIEAGDKSLGNNMLRKAVGFATRFHGKVGGRVTAMLGPHAVYSCSAELLQKVVASASELGVGMHIHLAESKQMSEEVEKACYLSEVEFLDKINFFRGHVLGAHCINLSKHDINILSERNVHAAYVPVANMKLGLGAARINDMLGRGLNVGLGTDGPASNNSLDMFETMKTGALLQKLLYEDPTVLPAYEILKMATMNGANALGIGDSVGSLEEGKKADIILVDLQKPHLTPLHDIYTTIVYSARGSDVDTVIVDGKILMENRQFSDLDENLVIDEAEKAALDLLSD